MRELTTDAASATGGAHDPEQRPSGTTGVRRVAGPPQPRAYTPTRSPAPGQTPPRDRARPDRRPGRSRARLSPLLAGLALGALSVVAAAPAAAQTDTRPQYLRGNDGYWRSDFFPRRSGNYYGCNDTSTPNLESCSSVLQDDRRFTYKGTTFTVTQLYIHEAPGGTTLSVGISPNFPAGAGALRISGGRDVNPHVDLSFTSDGSNSNFQWTNVTGLRDWGRPPASGGPLRFAELLMFPKVSLSVSPNPAQEGEGWEEATVTATLDSPWNAAAAVVFRLTETNGTAEDGDWVFSNPNIYITNGSYTGTTRILIAHDDDDEDETLTVALPNTLPCAGRFPKSCLRAGDTTSVQVTIDDDEQGLGGLGGDPEAPTVSLSAAPNPVAEGSQVMVTVKLSSVLSSAVTIPLTVTRGTSEEGDHGTLTSITIPAGGLSASGAIATNNDADDDDETFTVELDAYNLPSEVAAAVPPPITVTITDDASGQQTSGTLMERCASYLPANAVSVSEVKGWRDAHSDAAHVLRWNRVLKALGEDVGAGVSAMTVAESKANESRFMRSRWARVTATLEAIQTCLDGGQQRNAAPLVAAGDDEAKPAIVTDRAIAREGDDDAVVFTVRLDGPASNTVTVDYATADGAGVWASTGTATAGVDYTATSGTLSFAAGETSKSVSVPILDDVIDEGSEYFLLRLSNPQGATLEDREVEGVIRNTDMIPGALLARFGRATAEQVVTQIEERMAAPRQRGFRARFAGRELRSGQERDFALGLMSQFAQPMGMGPAGASPMGMGSHAAGAGAFGVSTPGMAGMGAAGGARDMTGMGGMPGAMGGGAAMGGYGPAGAAHGGGLLGSMGMGGDLFSNSEFELNRESRGGMLSVWSRSSRSYFSGLENALSLDGDVRTTMFGADYSRGALTVGLSVGRTLGMGGFRRDARGGQMTTSMTGFYPWVGYQVNDRVSVWGVTGYGTGGLSLTPDGRSAMETGVSMAMSAVGTRGELIGARATGGFALAFKADALYVTAASDLVDGAMGRLNASEAGVTRVRTALEGSRGYTLGGGRLSLRPSVEVGLRRDGGDAETGAGMDLGGGLAFTDAVTGLSLDVRVRTLVVHQAEGFTERGMSLSLGWDPTPSSPLGLTARVAPSWGGQSRGGAEALWGGQMAYGMGSHQMYGAGDRVDAEVGYGLPVGARLVGTPRVGLTTSQYGRDYRVGYGLGVLDRSDVNFELGVDAQRRESPMEGGASNGLMGRATLGW